jgi:capsular exopolysaccharide synthesis family protein
MASEIYPPDSIDPSGVYPRATLREVYFTLLKHRWAAVAVALATWLLGALSRTLETPVYRATALIQIDWEKINLVEDVMVNPTRGMADLYGTQEKIVRSRLLSELVVDDLELWTHPLFAAAGNAAADPKQRNRSVARAIQGMIDVRRVEKTQLMEVSFVTPDAELSADLVNSLVERYIQFNVDSESGLARGTSEFIDEEVEELRRDIIQKEKTLRDAARNKAIVMGDGADNIVMQRLETLNLQLVEAEAERAAAEAKFRSVSRADARSLEEVRNSGAVRELERKRLELTDKHEQLASTFGPDWPEMKRVKGAIAEVERSLERTIQEEARKIVGETRVSYQEALDRENLIRRSLEDQKASVSDLQTATADFEQVRVELENQRQMLQGLLKRRSETDLTADLGERQPVKIKIIERAETPAGPFAPGAGRRTMMVVLLGLVLGVATAYLMDHWDDSIHNVEDLKRYIPLPYLGMIPRYGDKPALSQLGRRLSGEPRETPADALEDTMASKRSNYLPTLYDRNPSLAESRNTLSERFRFLRGSMLLSTPGSVPKIVLVTSPDKSCGKTFVSSNLSCALVQLGKKVLLVDSDLRNPKLHRVFHYRNRVGLTNVLTGQKQLGDGCIMRTDIPNLFLLMAGPASPNPGELLASQAMEKILANCAEHFDFVILDSAPLLPVFDSHILSTRCDGVILVARAGVTSRHATLQSVELVTRVNGKITGIVLNDVNLDDYAQYYYHSNYTYEYGRYPSEDQRVRMG